MSLRELPPDQHRVEVRGPGRWRLIPLILLLVVVLALTGIGIWAKLRPATLEFDEFEELAATSVASAAAECRSDRSAALQGPRPWSTEHRDASEAVWQAGMVAPNSSSMIVGEDGWHFFGDDYVSNASQMVGRVLPSSTEIRRFQERYEGLAAALEEDGRRLVLLVAPAKWDVYRDRTPEWMQPITGPTTVDVLQAATPGLDWIDPRDALRDAPEPTYTPTNSHWTDYGGYIAWQHTAACLEALDPTFAGMAPPPLTGIGTKPDTGRNEFAHLGIADAGEVWTTPEFGTAYSDLTIEYSAGGSEVVPWTHQTDMTQFPLTVTNPEPQHEGAAILVGDSMTNAISPYIAHSFGTVHSLRHALGEAAFPDVRAIAAEYNAELVVIEIVERVYLGAWK